MLRWRHELNERVVSGSGNGGRHRCPSGRSDQLVSLIPRVDRIERIVNGDMDDSQCVRLRAERQVLGHEIRRERIPCRHRVARLATPVSRR
jgi:hypothetical protein